MRGAPRALLVVLLLASGAGLALHTAARKSLTADEPKHVATGLYQLETGRCCLGRDDNPTLVLNALPIWGGDHPGLASLRPAPDVWASGRAFLLAEPDLDATLWRVRLPSVALWLGTGILVFAWSRSLYGFAGGVLSLVLFAFSPLMLAHGSLATGDVHAAFFITLASFAWARSHERPGAAGVVVAGLCLGLALSAKFSALALVPCFAVLAAVDASRARLDARTLLLRPGLRTAAALAVAVLVLFLAYGGTLARQPLTAPPGSPGLVPGFADYADGLEAVVRLGRRGWDSYLLGHYGRGWWYYFPVTFAAKTPIPALLAFAAAAALTPFVTGVDRRREAFVWLPALVLFGGAMRSHLDIGLRHLLPVFPLLHVLAGRLVRVRWHARPAWRAALAVGAAWYVGAALVTHPDHLAYFNELAGGSRGGWRIAVDSNLDWGQDLKELARFLARHGNPPIRLSYFGPTPPGHYGIRYQPLPSYDDHPEDPPFTGDFGDREWVAVSVFNLVGVHPAHRRTYAWLRGREPIARPGGSIFVYDVTGDFQAHRELLRIYREAGEHRLEAVERARLREALDARDGGSREPPSTAGPAR